MDQAAVQKQLVTSGGFGYSTTTSHTVVTNHKPTVVTIHKPAVQKPALVSQKPAAIQHKAQPARKAPATAKRRGRYNIL